MAAAVVEIEKNEDESSGDAQMLLESVSLITPHFENITALIVALRTGNENAPFVEEKLAEVAVYHANNSEDTCFGRMDIVFIEKTQAGENAPKRR